MSDPTAVSILAKITSWYPFDSDFTDARGVNNLTAAVSPGFAVGKVGNYLLPAARAAATLAVAIPFTATTGSISVGGWFKFIAAIPLVASFGLTNSDAGENEALYIYNVSPNGNFGVFGWTATAAVSYSLSDPSVPMQAYPITIRVEDSVGQSATSDQILTIQAASGMTPGWYFIVATWASGVIKLYVDSVLVATGTPPPSVRAANITRVQIANTTGPTVSDAGLDEMFFCSAGVLTQTEVNWLYNLSAGRSYAALVAAAA